VSEIALSFPFNPSSGLMKGIVNEAMGVFLDTARVYTRHVRTKVKVRVA